MRRVFRLLPLPLCIAFSLSAQAADDPPEDYSLCPVDDAVPFFPDAQPPKGAPEDRANLPTDVNGDSVQGVSGETVTFQGNVALKRGDQFLGADNLSYNQQTDQYVAEGNVRYQDASMRMLADRATGKQDEDKHKIDNVRYQLTSRRGNGGAKEIQMDGTHGRLIGSSYSTCPPNDRRWELRAPQIDLDTEEGFATARNATVRIGKVPVLYMPWFKFPIDDRRHTGFLMPNLGQSSRNGFDYRQPIYFNLAPNYDLTLEPRIMTRRGVGLGTEFRYLTRTGKGVLDFDFLPSDDLTSREHAEELDDFTRERYSLANRRKSDRGRFAFIGSQNITRNWQALANLRWVSDPRYRDDFSSSLTNQSSYSSSSDIGLYGRGRYWDASLSASYYQLTDYTLPETSLAYNRLPRLNFNWEQPFGPRVLAGINTEATRFEHTADGSTDIFRTITATASACTNNGITYRPGDFLGNGVECLQSVKNSKPGGNRLDFKPYVSFPFGGAGWFITPTLAWRYTSYQLEGKLATQLATSRACAAINGCTTANPARPTAQQIAGFYDDNPTRSLPITSLDAGLYFDRSTTWGGESFLQTLEPRLFYLNAPYREQDGLPLFDTGDLTFSWGQLFRDNRYSGADRQADANQLTLAVTSRWLRESDSREKLSLSFGQILYFEDSRVRLNSSRPFIEEGKSAWVTDANYAINDRWTVGASYQWDPKNSTKDLASLRTRYLVGDKGIVNFAYRYRRNLGYDPNSANEDIRNPDLLEQVDLSFLYPINQTWSVVGRYYYSIRDKQLLEGIAGIQWDSCCLSARLVGRRYVRSGREERMNSSIQFELELKGLGSAGQKTESRLRRAILGYYRDDLYLVPPDQISNDGANNDDDPTDTLIR
ncbi:LPS-assembly protein LptD [Luteimonas aquatica]|uniref:LPS-assembly protein LptD n=1 Tax=Luteimonas aquatica TaxID=450364 RepID=UPI001F59EB65|nr:LPS-assembly protein LptD [Luteimonas aquatica]